MRFFPSLRSLTPFPSRPLKRTPSRRPRLGVETLEDRTVPSTIQGTLFQDANSNGTRDSGEAGVAGWTVFTDVNRNSVLDAGEASTVTDADGHYAFDTTNLPPAQVSGTTIRDYVALSLEAGAGGRWLNTTATFAYVDRNVEPDGVRDFGVRFQPFVGVAPVGPEALVNVSVAGPQGGLALLDAQAPPSQQFVHDGEPVSVAADAAGNYVVTWRTFLTPETDTIQARVFNADGTPRTGDLQVGTGEAASGTGFAVMPKVAMSADGTRFAVVWSNDLSSSVSSTLMRVYQGDGTAVTGAVTVVQGTSKTSAPVEGVAMDGDGDFAVLYGQSTYSNASGWSNAAVKVQRYTKAGAVSGAALAVVTPSLVNGEKSLAMDAAGNFVVVWDNNIANRGGGFTASVNAQRYDPAGRKVGSLIVVASQPEVAWQSSVAMAADGRFVVAWYSRVGQPGNAQLFGASGTRVGSVLAVTTNAAEQPLGVAYDQAGNVTFTFEDLRRPSGGGYAAASEIRFRRLTAAGQLEPESIVNTTTQGAQFRPGIAATANGGFVVAWQGYGPGDDAGIFSQRYAPLSALTAAAPAAGGVPLGAPLTAGALAPLVDEAIRRWVATADEGDFMHHPCHAGEVFADAQAGRGGGDGRELAAHLRRGVRLEVVGVEVAGTAVVEDEDARPDWLGVRSLLGGCGLRLP